MRIEQALQIEGIFDDEPKNLQFEDTPNRLVLDNGKPVKYLYRTVSKEELDDIKESGIIKPSQFFERIHASAIPVGGDGSANGVLKIKFNSSDGWKPKQASTGVFAVTFNKVDSDRIEEVLPTNTIGQAQSMIEEEQFERFQT
mgnify:CR=1 FL=1